MTKNFKAQVDDWVSKSEERLEAVFKLAAQELFYGVLKPTGEGGRLPVITGFLRNSFTVNLTGLLAMDQENPNKKGEALSVPFDDDVSVSISGAEIGDTIYGSFTAVYARRREYGWGGVGEFGPVKTEAGAGFVMTNAARWQDYVNEAVETVRASV